jgi:hypothetical protein
MISAKPSGTSPISLPLLLIVRLDMLPCEDNPMKMTDQRLTQTPIPRPARAQAAGAVRRVSRGFLCVPSSGPSRRPPSLVVARLLEPITVFV